MVVDAKAYASLEHETIAAEASKYLWGLRDAPAAPSTLPGGAPGVEEVVLVAPLGGPAPLAPREASQIACIAAAPHLPQPSTDLDRALNSAVVNGWLERLGLR